MAVTVMMIMIPPDNNWMNCIYDPNRLCRAAIALATIAMAIAGICTGRGNNEDTRNAGEREGSQRYEKVSRTIHYRTPFVGLQAASATQMLKTPANIAAQEMIA